MPKTTTIQWLLEKITQRFWDRVAITDDDSCWNWTASKNTGGYGHLNIHQMAHRLAYMLTHEDFDPSLCILHKCDNPACCRPDHLQQGTQTENVRDMDMKKRRKSKLNEDQIREIRRLYADGIMNQPAIGRKFGIHKAAISKIIGRHRHRNIN